MFNKNRRWWGEGGGERERMNAIICRPKRRFNKNKLF
jgi:hypothetical protein